MTSPLGPAPTVAPRDGERLVRGEITGLERAAACRIEDFLLGGGHNFAVDRTVAHQLLQVHPDLRRAPYRGGGPFCFGLCVFLQRIKLANSWSSDQASHW
nr:SAM-dependent methyltransferase [Salinispora arenicola]